MAVERVYTYGANLRRRRRDLRRRATTVGRGFLIALGVLLALGWWFSRDAWRLGDLTPAGRAVQICVTDLPVRLEAISASGIWMLLPETNPARAVLQQGVNGLPVPRWLVNNLSTGPSYWLLDRADDPSTLLVTTRMSRVGALAVKAASWLPVFRHDYAGGLKLLRLKDSELFLAVRGRVLLVSPSRRVLIDALTLTPDRAAGDAALELWRARAEGADLYGELDAAALERLGLPFSALAGSVRFEPGRVSARLKVTLSEAWRERLQPVLGRLAGGPLKEPPDGCASASMNLGMTPMELLRAIRDLVPDAGMVPEWLTAESPEMPQDPGEAFFRRFARMLLSGTGASYRLAWLGMDVNEMIPLPVVAGLAEEGQDALAGLAAEAVNVKAPVPEDPPMIEWTPRVAEDGAVYVRLMAGPALSLCAVPAGGEGIAFGGSLTAARVLAGQEKSAPAASAGNGIALVRIHPTACLEALSAAAHELASFGWLRNMTPSAIDSKVALLRSQIGVIREVRMMLAPDQADAWQLTAEVAW